MEDRPIDDFSFASFSENVASYRDANSRLIDLAKLSLRKRIVDLGCGVGGSTREIIKRIKSLKDTIVYAVDISADALHTAARHLSDTGARVEYITSDATNINKHLSDSVDAIVYCNSIHYVPDKQDLVQKLGRLLSVGGVLAFNSSFIHESHTGLAQTFYNRWALRAIKLLKKEYGLKPTKDVVESRRRLKADDYVQLLEQNGFKVQDCKLEPVDFDAASFSKLSEFRDWIHGFLPGVPMDIASDVLQRSVYETFKLMGIKSIPRMWLQLVATKA